MFMLKIDTEQPRYRKQLENIETISLSYYYNMEQVGQWMVLGKYYVLILVGEGTQSCNIRMRNHFKI